MVDHDGNQFFHGMAIGLTFRPLAASLSGWSRNRVLGLSVLWVNRR